MSLYFARALETRWPGSTPEKPPPHSVDYSLCRRQSAGQDPTPMPFSSFHNEPGPEDIGNEGAQAQSEEQQKRPQQKIVFRTPFLAFLLVIEDLERNPSRHLGQVMQSSITELYFSLWHGHSVSSRQSDSTTLPRAGITAKRCCSFGSLAVVIAAW